MYGVIDQYVNYLHSSSGTSLKSLEDGAFLRSRWGLRGVEDMGGGLQAKFLVEGGFSTDTGVQADASRYFDRQSWVGIAGPYGEVRFGRQNGPIQARGGFIDFTERTLGSVINNFGVPSRYDNDFAYLSPRIAGVQAEVHYAIPETALGNKAAILQGAVDWTDGTWRAGYMGIRGKPQTGATVDKDMVYDNVYGNYKYGGGAGTVYLAYVRSNNNTATAVSNNAGSIVSNVGGFNAGTNADLNNFYTIWQVSADYWVTPLLRVGALWGQIDDKSGRGRGASGGAVGAYYSLSKRTTLIALVDTLRNDSNGGWRPSGSAGLKTTFTAPTDINGRTLNGLQFGVVHKF
ncbi:MAG: porin [Burkholderiales bacterium PBB5]|nr:MAG: porin [Burkholderiales bacterium PBB5]